MLYIHQPLVDIRLYNKRETSQLNPLLFLTILFYPLRSKPVRQSCNSTDFPSPFKNWNAITLCPFHFTSFSSFHAPHSWPLFCCSYICVFLSVCLSIWMCKFVNTACWALQCGLCMISRLTCHPSSLPRVLEFLITSFWFKVCLTWSVLLNMMLLN